MDEASRRLAHGIELFLRERFDLAIEPLADVLRQNPENADALARLAYCYANVERKAEAIELCKSARRCAPDDDYVAYLVAGTALICNEIRLSEECIEQALRTSPGNPSYLTMKANQALHRSKWRKALDVASKALILDPENVDAMRIRTVAARGLGILSTEIEQQQITDRTAPANPAVRAESGWIHLQQGKLEQAERDFREAMRSDPALPYYRNGLTETLRASNPLGVLLRRINWGSHRAPYVPLLVSSLGLAVVFSFSLWGSPLGLLLAVGSLMYVMPFVLFAGYGPMVACIGLTKHELRQLVPAREVAKGILLWIAIASVVILAVLTTVTSLGGLAPCYVAAVLVLPPLSLLLGCTASTTAFKTKLVCGILLVVTILSLALTALGELRIASHATSDQIGSVLKFVAAVGPVILASLWIRITVKPKVEGKQ